jgi:hypothetical protein
VVLSEADRSALVRLMKCGRTDARQIRRAHILLQGAEGHSDEVSAAALHTSPSTVERTRRRFVQEGLERALRDRPRPGARASWTASLYILRAKPTTDDGACTRSGSSSRVRCVSVRRSSRPNTTRALA